jgi:hypothetical protein
MSAPTTARDTRSGFGFREGGPAYLAHRGPPNEAARMTRSDIVGYDWVIPAERIKNKREHVIPLSETARAILQETNGRLWRHLNGFSNLKKEFDRRCGVAGWIIHDLRRTARSLMSRAGVAAGRAMFGSFHGPRPRRLQPVRLSQREEGGLRSACDRNQPDRAATTRNDTVFWGTSGQLDPPPATSGLR